MSLRRSKEEGRPFKEKSMRWRRVPCRTVPTYSSGGEKARRRRVGGEN